MPHASKCRRSTPSSGSRWPSAAESWSPTPDLWQLRTCCSAGRRPQYLCGRQLPPRRCGPSGPTAHDHDAGDPRAFRTSERRRTSGGGDRRHLVRPMDGDLGRGHLGRSGRREPWPPRCRRGYNKDAQTLVDATLTLGLFLYIEVSSEDFDDRRQVGCVESPPDPATAEIAQPTLGPDRLAVAARPSTSRSHRPTTRCV
jgi:hypothetical protein